MQVDFGVHKYSVPKLRDLFLRSPGVRKSRVEAKLQSEYFQGYFQTIGARTIVVEHDYVDRDFLDDYAGYYVRCFTPPPTSHCMRLHFFSSSFTKKQFVDFLTGPVDRDLFKKQKLLGDNYLGFIVVKPLPETFIGKTCLKTYPESGTGRHYPVLRYYDANLFGVPLTVKSLAFEEQDREVAQCATSALWSVLQGTAIMFGHPIPSPVEITRSALAGPGHRSRTFPTTDGLTIEQLADAVRKVKLEPYCADAKRHEVLQTHAYAYLRSGIPALLSIALWDTLDEAGNPHRITGQSGLVDVALPYHDGDNGHAIALTGYHLMDAPPVPYGQSGILLTATRIDKFYAHDDQVGAFSRLILSPAGAPKPVRLAGNYVRNRDYMETSWSGASGVRGSVISTPETLLVPLYPKMRIPFEVVLEAVIEFDAFVEQLRRIGRVPGLSSRLEWDIHLTTSGQLKADDELWETNIDPVVRRSLLTKSLPRFVWRARGRHETQPFLDLLFDATDLLQGKVFLEAAEHQPAAFDIIRSGILSKFDLSPIVESISEWFERS